MIVSKKISINTQSIKAIPVVKVVQDDSGRQLVIKMNDMDLESTYSARIYARKPSGLIVYNDLTVDAEANTVTADITNQMIAETGDTVAQVIVTHSEETVTSFVSCGVAYTFQIFGQKYVEPTRASLILCLESVVSVLAGWLLLSQALSIRELIGCVIMFVAIILAQFVQKEEPADDKKSLQMVEEPANNR